MFKSHYQINIYRTIKPTQTQNCGQLFLYRDRFSQKKIILHASKLIAASQYAIQSELHDFSRKITLH